MPEKSKAPARKSSRTEADMKITKNASAAALAAALAVSPAYSDEGMWTLDNLPAKQLQERFGFTPSPEWQEHVRLASVRFNDGGSGAFVSAEGLVITNHHVALGQLQKMSTAENDYVKDGFFARSRSEERKSPDLELNVLVSMENVTDKVLSAVDRSAAGKLQNEQRKAAMARLEKESTEKTGNRSDVIELYQGGEYWLYRFKKYTDIRLVWAPESQIAFYGGDPDNFTFPRFDMDAAFFRVYEDGVPVRPAKWFRWSKAGAPDGELVFVSGHPGSTDRMKTLSQLEFQRDYAIPSRLKTYKRRLKALYDYSARGKEQERRAKDRIFGIENAVKAVSGELGGLEDPKLLARKADAERELRVKIANNKPLRPAEESFQRISKAQDGLIRRSKEIFFRKFLGGKLPDLAGTIVRYTAEVEKPNEKRFEEFRDSALESLNLRLFSPAPIYKDMEEALLTDALQESLDELGANDPHVKAALGGKTPAAKAKELVSATKIDDAKVRKALIQGGKKAVEASTDPLIVWARGLDASYRELRKWYEDGIQGVESLEGQKIAEARFALYGKSVYPDATFTLRLSFGRVLGYDQGTNRIPPKTTFHGLYDRAESFSYQPPYDLPKRVLEAKDALNLATPLNFVTTNDIIGGNSGSPVLNKDLEYVGLIFDGNIQSLVGRYAYEGERGRAVAVHSSGILEALTKIYGMKELARELTVPAIKPLKEWLRPALTPAGARPPVRR